MPTETYKGFTFQYVKDPEDSGKIKVYINDQPSYGGLDTTSEVVHVWPGKNGSPPYICIKSDNKPASLSEAKKLAHDWADRTEEYIRTGVTISDQFKNE